MNNLLEYIGISFSQLIVLIIVIVTSIVVIRITISFDVNKYLKDRKATYLPKLQNACTHVELIPHGKNQMESRLLFISPPGTIQWQCQRCGAVKYMNPGEGEEMQQYYLEHIDEYNRKMKLFGKLLKKSGHI